ncbi:MAG TPA: DUF1361 domain-containing protein [Polyangia bacterium]
MLSDEDPHPAVEAPERRAVRADQAQGETPAPAPRALVRMLLVLALASGFCGALALARVGLTGRGALLFLGWNLVLAWVPLLMSVLIVRHHAPGRRPSRLGSLVLGAFWLAFFPNAPYLVTDLIHLRAHGFVLQLFDAMMVFAFALTGICIAFLSLWLVHRLVERRVGRVVGWAFVAAVAGLSGFGVFLGRFPRWNSWDLVTRPGELFVTLAVHAQDPFAHPRAIGVTVVMAALFAIAYLMFFAVTSLDASFAASRPPPPDSPG